MMLNASLDTSFWNIGAQIGVVPYLFNFFHVHYCKAVEAEIVTTDPEETALIYPQAMLFQVMQEARKLILAEPQKPLLAYGSGEAHAIALAQEKNCGLLINDYRPLKFARQVGIPCISVPAFCVLLYAERKITYPAAKGYLHRLAATTSQTLLREANEVVEEIAQKRGER